VSINAKQLRELIIRPTLINMDMWSQSAENLLMGTAAQESKLGHYIAQVKGPALGIYQCEPATHEAVAKWAKERDLWPFLTVQSRRLVYDLEYATLICRLHYRSISEPLPDANDVNGLGSYWKRFYNSEKGKGTVVEFVKNYELTLG
jgi:hypothetical protein